jgi:hypothetical protein
MVNGKPPCLLISIVLHLVPFVIKPLVSRCLSPTLPWFSLPL